MLDSKFFFTLVGLIIAVFAICNTNMTPVSEGFIDGVSRYSQPFEGPCNNYSVNYNTNRPYDFTTYGNNDNADNDVNESDDDNKFQDLDDSQLNQFANGMENIGDDINTNECIYDRQIFVNKKSRTRGQGDPIRGDLPIAPCKRDWFQTSASPQDLRLGAINQISNKNENDKLIDKLIDEHNNSKINPMTQILFKK